MLIVSRQISIANVSPNLTDAQIIIERLNVFRDQCYKCSHIIMYPAK